MRPRMGIRLEDAARQLRSLAMAGRNAQSGGPSLDRRRNDFLVWVHDVERTLHSLFTGVPMDRLQTERFWRIHAITEATARPHELISDEIEVQVNWLSGLGDLLDEQAERLGAAAGVIAVPDTHVLLHYRLFDEVPWRDVLDAAPVRLAVPLRVVDELDAKKASRRTDLAQRAATVLAHLEQHVGTSAGGPSPLRDDVTIEVVQIAEIDSEPYRQVADGDAQILDTCEMLMFFSGNPVRLVTGDYGMRLRAAARSIPVVQMPESLRLGRETSSDGSAPGAVQDG